MRRSADYYPAYVNLYCFDCDLDSEAKKWHIEQGHVGELDNVLVEV